MTLDGEGMKRNKLSGEEVYTLTVNEPPSCTHTAPHQPQAGYCCQGRSPKSINLGESAEKMKHNSVLQNWVCDLPWKKQTVLIGAIRSPDVLTTLKFKQVTTWIRSKVLEDADPRTAFMRDATLPKFEHVEREFERLPLHCAHHILLALQVILFDHPDSLVQYEAEEWYRQSLMLQHLNPENRGQYEARYIDQVDRVETPS